MTKMSYRLVHDIVDEIRHTPEAAAILERTGTCSTASSCESLASIHIPT